MGYPQELLHSAISFYQVDPKTQATLRRAVSTAYYSLFHFLIEETCRNWARPEQRGMMARVFDHKAMLGASNRHVEKHKNASLGSREFHLYSVAYAFCQLQSKRHDADYDLSKTFSSSVVELDIVLVKEAFTSWDVIR